MKQLVNTLLQRIPRKVPTGKTEFLAFTDRIISIAGPIADRDSMTFVIGTSMLHADASAARISDKFFVDRLRKAAANQVASVIFQEIKNKQLEEAAKKAAEATALTEVASSDEKQTQETAG